MAEAKTKAPEQAQGIDLDALKAEIRAELKAELKEERSPRRPSPAPTRGSRSMSLYSSSRTARTTKTTCMYPSTGKTAAFSAAFR